MIKKFLKISIILVALIFIGSQSVKADTETIEYTSPYNSSTFSEHGIGLTITFQTDRTNYNAGDTVNFINHIDSAMLYEHNTYCYFCYGNSNLISTTNTGEITSPTLDSYNTWYNQFPTDATWPIPNWLYASDFVLYRYNLVVCSFYGNGMCASGNLFNSNNYVSSFVIPTSTTPGDYFADYTLLPSWGNDTSDTRYKTRNITIRDNPPNPNDLGALWNCQWACDIYFYSRFIEAPFTVDEPPVNNTNTPPEIFVR
jgi:hypothetical protein